MPRDKPASQLEFHSTSSQLESSIWFKSKSRENRRDIFSMVNTHDTGEDPLDNRLEAGGVEMDASEGEMDAAGTPRWTPLVDQGHLPDNPVYYGRPKPKRHIVAAKLFLAGACCAALICAIFVSLRGVSESEVTKAETHVHEVVYYDSALPQETSKGSSSDELPECVGVGDTQWRRIVMGDFRVPTALNMSFRLASIKRMKCDPPLGPLEWDPEMFILDKYRDKEVVVMHKFSADCHGESFFMAFRIAGNPETKFDMEVHHNRGTNLWTLLETDPAPCGLLAGPGTSASPRIVSPGSEEVRNAANFAVGEINFRAKENNCLNNDEQVKLGHVRTATVVVKTGLKYVIHAALVYHGFQYTAALTVIQRCSGTKTQCFYQLELPDGRPSMGHPNSANTPWCDPLSFMPENNTALAGSGVINEDRTNNFVSQRVLLYPRQLGDGAREPLQERYIAEGDVPAMHDPRPDDCFTKVAVYNEGQCNAGYASAWAGMMGARQCMEDKKHRRLQGIAENTYNGNAKDRELESVDEPRKPCQDDPNWSAFGSGRMNCDHFKIAGCKGVDYGQFTHCRLSCGSCPAGSQGAANPWAQADYKYMPSVEDLLSCSKEPDGAASGCKGGNMWSLWDNFLSKSERPLWISGSDCKAYTLKCWNEQKIVNALNDGLCWAYKDYQLWHRPCSCIPESQRPKKLPQCDAESPPGDCQFAVPPAAFVVRGVSSGLSLQDAQLNYQRHIIESGPLYVAVTTSMSFFNWDWKKNPVYTGGGVIAGGTAMMMLGWGGGGYAYIPQKFWILRNSWGADWQDKGSVLWLRGENLHGIENQGGVVMPSAEFTDWSAPICRLTSWSRRWTTQGKTLTKYDLQIRVRCSEDCMIKAFFSNQLSKSQANGNDVGWDMDGVVRSFPGKKHEEVVAPILPLHLRGYGVKDADMWLAIQATDDSLNSGETTNIFNIPAIPGVETIQERAQPELVMVTTATTTTIFPVTPFPSTTTTAETFTMDPNIMKQEKIDKAQKALAQLKEKKKKQFEEIEKAKEKNDKNEGKAKKMSVERAQKKQETQDKAAKISMENKAERDEKQKVLEEKKIKQDAVEDKKKREFQQKREAEKKKQQEAQEVKEKEIKKNQVAKQQANEVEAKNKAKMMEQLKKEQEAQWEKKEKVMKEEQKLAQAEQAKREKEAKQAKEQKKEVGEKQSAVFAETIAKREKETKKAKEQKKEVNEKSQMAFNQEQQKKEKDAKQAKEKKQEDHTKQLLQWEKQRDQLEAKKEDDEKKQQTAFVKKQEAHDKEAKAQSEVKVKTQAAHAKVAAEAKQKKDVKEKESKKIKADQQAKQQAEQAVKEKEAKKAKKAQDELQTQKQEENQKEQAQRMKAAVENKKKRSVEEKAAKVKKAEDQQQQKLAQEKAERENKAAHTEDLKQKAEAKEKKNKVETSEKVKAGEEKEKRLAEMKKVKDEKDKKKESSNKAQAAQKEEQQKKEDDQKKQKAKIEDAAKKEKAEKKKEEQEAKEAQKIAEEDYY